MNSSFAARYPSRLFWFTLAAGFACSGPLTLARADTVPTGDVSPSNPPGWTNLTYGYIGNTASGTLTVNGGSHLLSRDAYIGYESAAAGVVDVAGAGSTWTMGYDLDVGVYGSGTLSITSGGSVSCSSASIGSFAGSTGLATISGTGSTWHTNGLDIGHAGNGTLSITGGGSVSSSWSYIGSDYGSTGAATVDGTGSTWTSGGNLYIGDSSSGTLSISNGGAAACNFYSYIGNSSGGNGLVTVSGTGSTWTNSATLYVGNSGSGTLSISDGSAVASKYGLSCYVGNGTGSTGMVTVDGAGSTWTNSGSLQVGNSGSGTLSITDGGAVSSNSGYIGVVRGGAGDATVDGTGSTWTNNSFLTVGCSGSGALSIANGATVSSTYCFVGDSSGSSGAVTVNGTGTTLTTSLYLFVGHSGSGTLTISGGGSVSSGGDWCNIGDASGSQGLVTVDGKGSTWAYSGYFFLVGNSGSGTLSITNGGAVSNTCGFLGNCSGASGSVAVSGTGSRWTNSVVAVGRSGSGTLSIAAAGTVDDVTGDIGTLSGSKGVAQVDGAGSIWANSTYFYVGNSGSGTLSVVNGGAVSNSIGYIGRGSGSKGAVTVGGTGSAWINSDNLYVGISGNGSLSITGGGSVSNSAGYVGYNSGSQGTVAVDGAGSNWTNNGNLYVGNDGSGTLSIAGGGFVSVTGTTYVGANSAAIYLGDSGSGGTLTTNALWGAAISGYGAINTGALVGDVNLVAGSAHTFTLNGTAIVTMTGAGDLGVGYRNAGSLTIDNGTTVNSAESYLGYNSGSKGTAAVSGSTWASSGNLYVGYSGNGTLSITSGGSVSSAAGYIGASSGSSGTVTVDGTGSILTTISELTVGSYGNGTLSITGGGSVGSYFGHLGYANGSSGAVTLDGADSKWSSRGNLYVGYGGAGTVTQNGGTNSVTGTLYLGYYSGGKGTYNLNDGLLELHVLSKGNGAAAFNFGGGTLRIDGTMNCSVPMALTGNGGNANVDTAGYDGTLSGILSGSGGLNKRGVGKLTLNARDTYRGETDIYAGTLALGASGSIGSSLLIDVMSTATLDVSAKSGGFSLGSSQTLEGAGNVLGAIIATLGSHIEPGDGLGTLTLGGNLTLNDGALLDYELEAVGSSDRIVMTDSTLYLNGQDFSDFSFTALSGFGDGTYTLIDAKAISGALSTSNLSGTIVGGHVGTLSVLGNRLVLTVVPEPGTLTLLAASLVGLLAYVWRRREHGA